MTDIRSFFLKNKTASVLLAIALAGGLLLIFGQDGGNTKLNAENIANEEYISGLENKIEQMIAQICKGDVTVIVTAESSEEYVYAENVEESSEKSGADAVRTSKSTEYAVINGQTVVKTVLKPKIRGIAVVCRGGDEPALQYKIINLLSCAYGISEAKICVAGL